MALLNEQGLPFLNRNLRGFEAMMEHVKSDGQFIPSDKDVVKLMEIEKKFF